MTNQRKNAYLIIGGSVIFLLGLLLMKVLITPAPVCDPKIKSKTVVLLDRSQGVAKQTTEAIVNRTWQHIEDSVSVGELVTIYDLTQDSKKNLKPIFQACKPRNEGSQLTENAKRVKLEFQNFNKKLKNELANPIDGSDESPLAQALIDLSLDNKNFQSKDVTKLLIFSDFMEHTPKFSLYKCTDGKQAIQQFRSSKTGAMERPEFNNVEVQMHLIPRDDISKSALQCRPIFWNWFFGDNKGSCKKNSCLTPIYLPG